MVIDRAASTTRLLLTGDRLAHSLSVGQRTSRFAQHLNAAERQALSAAGYLHDIGYSEQCIDTGWHPLDGARWLQHNGWGRHICQLVAWHSCGWYEARIRGLDHVTEAEFGPPLTTTVADALTATDLTTGPTGDSLSFNDRIANIRQRYRPDDIVIRALGAAETRMREALDRTERAVEDATRATKEPGKGLG